MNLRRICLTLALPSFAATLAWGTAAALQDSPTPEELREQARPGAEHARLADLEGSWAATFEAPGVAARKGGASAQSILGGRFLVVDYEIEGAGETRATLGFDRRHGEWSIVVMDTTGTYFVTARGPEVDGVARMAGDDDDPYMASLGFEKKFEFELEIESDDVFRLATIFLDTRTEEVKRVRANEVRFTRDG